MERLKSLLAWLRRQVAEHLTLLWIFLPVTALALILAAYGWWWQVVADGVRGNIVGFQTQQRALGRGVDWESLAVAGFPYRVQATLSTVHFTAPDRATAFDGERIVATVRPFSLGRVALSLEGQQHFFYARERWLEADARADKAHIDLADGRGALSAELDIERLTGKAKIDDTEFNFIVEAVNGGLKVADATALEPLPRVDLVARVTNVALQGNLDLPLGPSIALIDIDAGLKLPANMTDLSGATVLAEWRRTGTPLEIRRFELDWGGVSVAASGAFKLDAQALPDGRLTLTLGNHARILELLEANGLINKDTHGLAKKVLDVLAFMSGDAQRRVSVPLRIEAGVVYLGPARVMILQPPPATAQVVPPDPAP